MINLNILIKLQKDIATILYLQYSIFELLIKPKINKLSNLS